MLTIYFLERVSWTTPEKNIVRKEFGHLIDAGIVPTYAECTEIKEQNPCLKTRTPPQIKSFIAYEAKKLHTPTNTKKGLYFCCIEHLLIYLQCTRQKLFLDILPH